MFAKARTGQYPSPPYVGASGVALKALRKRFDPAGEPLQRIADAAAVVVGGDGVAGATAKGDSRFGNPN